MCGMIILREASWKDPAERIQLGSIEEQTASNGKERKEASCDLFLIHAVDLKGKVSIMDKVKEEYEQRKLMDFIVRG